MLPAPQTRRCFRRKLTPQHLPLAVQWPLDCEMSPSENLLISALPRAARARLMAQCSLVDMPAELVLWKPGEQSNLAFFPVSGYISLEAITVERQALEVGMVGREGMAGMHLLLGASRSNLHACALMPGAAYVCSATELRLLMLDSLPIRVAMGRYIDLTLKQLAASAVCVRFHNIGQRLAKWLLMAQDRAGSDVLRVTQGTMAHLLGVRRVGITAAAAELQGAGHIRYNRGEIKLLNRIGLEGCTCSCYFCESDSKQS